ncbi:MAG: MazG nucleotide pyrophosphohydrolase domain-containing protein [Eubacteriales bacterium]|nr:MazG nucleotide pyrophosphohydrolase domain-containing protein [Eubacteriales bacterium]MDD4475895.1 MazG nucleotide pyrophosphohydrolase domain-containing protein [Eubacteriales bacterium]
MSITINYLQKYLKLKDYNPEVKEQYFMKLSEEVGELSRSMLKNQRMTDGRVKGTIEEELWDVIYYAIAIANLYKIDLEEVIPLKEKLNNEKYQTGINFGDEV